MIKNIIFDFGDVFLNLDKQAPYRVLKNHGIEALRDADYEVLLKFEVGACSSEEVMSFFSEKYPITKTEFKEVWNSMLLDFPAYRMNWLRRFKAQKNYQMFLLSNTNEMHISWVQNNWGSRLYAEFKNCFQEFYLSHEIHLRKPNREIYDFVLVQNGLNPKETLFIDDTKENTDAAKELGITTWNIIPKKEDIVELESKFGL